MVFEWRWGNVLPTQGLGLTAAQKADLAQYLESL
jgi:hypothetical protein